MQWEQVCETQNDNDNGEWDGTTKFEQAQCQGTPDFWPGPGTFRLTLGFWPSPDSSSTRWTRHYGVTFILFLIRLLNYQTTLLFIISIISIFRFIIPQPSRDPHPFLFGFPARWVPFISWFVIYLNFGFYLFFYSYWLRLVWQHATEGLMMHPTSWHHERRRTMTMMGGQQEEKCPWCMVCFFFVVSFFLLTFFFSYWLILLWQWWHIQCNGTMRDTGQQWWWVDKGRTVSTMYSMFIIIILFFLLTFFFSYQLILLQQWGHIQCDSTIRDTGWQWWWVDNRENEVTRSITKGPNNKTLFRCLCPRLETHCSNVSQAPGESSSFYYSTKAWQGYKKDMTRVWPYLQNFTTNYLSDFYHSWAICRAFNNLKILSHKRKFAFNRKVRVWKKH